jgi:hypothetical protein
VLAQTGARCPASFWQSTRFEGVPMRNLLQKLTLVCYAVITASCATTMNVSSHVQHGLDFSQYRTFEWGPPDALPTGDPRLDQDSFFKDHVQGAVEKELYVRGLSLSPVTSPGDLQIHYHASITKRLEIDRQEYLNGYCSSGDCQPQTVDYEAGTLILDIVDARSEKLIWRGWAQHSVEDMLHDRDRMAATIQRAVGQMLVRFPVKAMADGQR